MAKLTAGEACLLPTLIQEFEDALWNHVGQECAEEDRDEALEMARAALKAAIDVLEE